MPRLKPIYDHNRYSTPIATAIYHMLYTEIFAPLLDILENGEKRNALAKGKPTIEFQGIPIHIENPKGSERRGRNWTQVMAHDYGYICKTKANDGDELDCFIGPNKDSPHVYIVTQIKPNTGQFDEYKVLFGFNDSLDANRGYLANYELGWRGLGRIEHIPLEDFDSWYFRMQLGLREQMNGKTTSLIEALKSGRLQYVNGLFIGPVNASISRELRSIGAIYNKVKKAYKLDRGSLPPYLISVISDANLIAKEKLKKVDDFLKSIDGRKLALPELDPFFGNTISGLNKQFQSTTRKLTGQDIEIPLAERFKEQLAEGYTTNLDMYINNWQEEQVLRIKAKVSDNVQAGFRADRLITDIQAEKQVSYNKAKFLARQETSLMVSKYRQIRYEDVGVTKYQWSTSHDERVRPAHKALQGKIFRFDQPPVTDLHTMARNNPGEDYNCRCVAIPVLSNMEILEKQYGAG